MYKAKNVDTDKALKYINDSRRYQQQAETLAITSAQNIMRELEKVLILQKKFLQVSIANLRKEHIWMVFRMSYMNWQKSWM
ncbi:hypothetical protein FYJ45_24535 [Eisenbergiella tayi]|uniref:Uncharacterized protein n=1 Tax=Eisenbergiella porci TaxID=2652274 RepID=A0A6N7W7Q6_9FIRM|nr:hypothetical protein [Eisenbergiella porci]MSS91286.1 hypothetical protein [Eisenbergiella porci]